MPAVGGSLFPSQFLEDGLQPAVAAIESTDVERTRRHLLRWWTHVAAECGPATGLRAIYDIVAVPLFSMLGFRAGRSTFARDQAAAVIQTRLGTRIGVLLLPWARHPPSRWRNAVDVARDAGAAWAFVLAPPYLSLVDAAGRASRRTLDFTLPQVFDRQYAARFLLLCRADAFEPRAASSSNGLTSAGNSWIRSMLEAAARHQDGVRRDLEHGVVVALHALQDALRRPPLRVAGRSRFDEALTLVYRVLFLLFAESRDMVPQQHPIYRRGYAVGEFCREALRTPSPHGLWEGLAAVTRLSRTGVDTGDLIVRPFNGHLFARAAAPSLEPPRPVARATAAAAIRDVALGRALVALGSRQGSGGRETIAYADLGVEQLGAVYERVLDLDPDTTPALPLTASQQRRSPKPSRHSLLRKQSGTFYTPQPLTEFVVRRTLAPLVEGASSDEILALRVVDPAMGSGAFLVAACQYLANAYERAQIDEGCCSDSDVDDETRAGMRRLIAERCLAGVDVNPVAVQVARLSLWLTALARGKPLNFLDHRLRVGNSLIGTTPEYLSCIGLTGRRAAAELPLLDQLELEQSVKGAARPLRALIERRDDSIDDVRAKETAWQRLTGTTSPLAPWRLACDVWCARWFADDPPSAAEARALRDALLHHDATLGANQIAKRLNRIRTTAECEGFFHWPLEFADVFYDESGQPKPRPGFDAVIGNPPWEVLRDESHRRAAVDNRRSRESDRRRDRSARFIRESGLYGTCSRGHLNLYQPFVERSLQIARPGGRIGLVLPWSLATDDGAAAVRARLLDEAGVDTVVGFENSNGIFPVHRGLRFLLLTAGRGATPRPIRARFGVRDLAELEALPGRDDPLSTAYPIRLTREQLAVAGGPLRRIPDLRRASDAILLERLSSSFPQLGSTNGWQVRFGRELNATDDRDSFGDDGLPVIEGKHIQPFVVSVPAMPTRIAAERALAKLPDRRHERHRLAYRDVSAAGNRLSLIAAIVPAGVVTTHSLFCLRTPLSLARQHFLCGVFNSYVLNSVVRLLMGSHVTSSLVEALPVPVWSGRQLQRRIAHWSRALASHPDDGDGLATLQAAVARMYGLDREAFVEVLDGFPLVPIDDRRRALRAFDDQSRTALSMTTKTRP